MKIRRVSVLSFVRKLDGRAFNPVFRWRERRAPLLLVETDSGARGIGEAWSRYTDSRSVFEALAQVVAPALLGLELEHPRDAAARLRIDATPAPWALAAALSAVDIALWDAYGHEQAQPIWRLLGGNSELAPVYASGGLYRDAYTEQDLEAEMAAAIGQGFRAVKMKVAGLPLADDLRRVQAVREAVGDGTVLWVDAVNQLTVPQAKQWWSALSKRGVAAIQSPIPFEDVAGLALLKREGVPVIASESEFRHAAFHDLLQQRAVTHLQFCLPLCGGFSGACRLDDEALAQGVSTTPQCFSTSIAQAATLHFAAARPNVVSAEYHGFHDHLKSLYRDGTGAVAAGKASAGLSPGLGVKVPALGLQEDGSLISIYQPSA
jgi:L-alanine-DL-glutamate epimerase-like enolase superfamily enzyme